MKESWQRNLVVLWFGTFMTGIGSSLIAPFISLYISTLGNYSKTELNIWSGLVFSSTFIVLAIVSPLWGRLADQKGRKLMLLRASLGMAVVISLMAFVTAAWQLLILRMLLGAFSGFISNSMALMASSAPKEKSGSVLSLLTTGSVAGTLIGPIVGGILVNFTGYRRVFSVTGIIMFLVFFLALFFVKETFKPIEKKDMLSASEVWKVIAHPSVIWGMFFATLITQMTNQSINPVLSLYVQELMHGQGNITFMAGIVAAAPGIVTLIAAPFLGRLGDQVGQRKILGFGLIFSFIVFSVTATTTNIWFLIVMRLLVGISDAAILPSVQAILAKESPQAVTGRIFSYNQSAQSIGAFAGPLLGSAIAGFIDYRYVFVGSAILVVFNLINYFSHTKELAKHS
ncbi:multidrug efflux MFS transporter [Lactococcus taiwanensis]|uniref:multidrug efflux MFS transporter n=1 Tax=Lactococcus taiwanensis TaxID=1151742 RepID=UPI0007B1AA77|nr:multidrug efflux MFS transporter [Lactococcus taiwanensis]KZK38062.1 Multidrug-efflux transporter major facilitator superfamily (MFS) [Lactococcus cremoris]QRZ10638.1 multidrug efflux MFS transporter [Lactococcus taiwanensis]